MYYFWKFLYLLNGFLLFMWALPLSVMMKLQMWLRRKIDPQFDQLAQVIQQVMPMAGSTSLPMAGLGVLSPSMDGVKDATDKNSPETQQYSAQLAQAMGMLFAAKMQESNLELVSKVKKLVDEKVQKVAEKQTSLPIVETEKRS